MTDRLHNFADAIKLTRSEREEVIRLTLHLVQEYLNLWGRLPTAEDVQARLEGRQEL